ncbi:hypothetical protein [Vibrio sp. TRT 17S01]|uniref:hypothetical protein n=1 Tax=Vibrio sp. TRT 17S01 TaxID=3418505 RepID=UPI003CF298D9
MKKSPFRLNVLAALVLSFPVYSAGPTFECSDQATEKARALFLKHYKRKDYAAAYYSLYLYTDTCPELFRWSANEKSLWLISDYALVATKLADPQRCEEAARLVHATSPIRKESIEQAFLTNLSICSVQQIERQTQQIYSRRTCKQDKSMLALPEAWNATFAGYDNVECVGPKTLTPDSNLSVLTKNIEGKFEKSAIQPDQNIEDGKTRLLFLDEAKPSILVNVFNPADANSSQPTDKPVEYLTARNTEQSQQQIDQVDIVNRGMTFIVADKQAQASVEYMESMKASVMPGLTVDFNATWIGKELVTERPFSSSNSYAVAQYDNQVKVIFSYFSSPEVRMIDLLTGKESVLFVAKSDIRVSSVIGSKVYLSQNNDPQNTLMIDLRQDELKAVLAVNPPQKITGHASGSIPSPHGDAKLTLDDGVLKIEDTQGTSVVINIRKGNNGWSGWLINYLGWGVDNYEFYFDNSSAFACIWRADLLNKRLERIVPVEDAVKPYAFRIGNVPYVLYTHVSENKLYLASLNP